MQTFIESTLIFNITYQVLVRYLFNSSGEEVMTLQISVKSTMEM